MLLIRVARSLSGTSCTSGVPWRPPVASSSFHFLCSQQSNLNCDRMENCTAGTNRNYWRKRTFFREQFLVKYRSKITWSRKSLISPCHASPLLFPCCVSPLSLHHQTPFPSPLALKSSLSSKPSKENSNKQGIIARYKQMMKDYWYVLIPVHVATSIVWFGGFFVMLKSGVDIVGFLEMIGTSQK